MVSPVQYSKSIQEIKAKAPAIINQVPGISLDRLATRLGFTRRSARYSHLKIALQEIAVLQIPEHAGYNSAEAPHVYPIGYQIPERKNVVAREIPCKVYKPGHPDYDRVWKETVGRKSA